MTSNDPIEPLDTDVPEDITDSELPDDEYPDVDQTPEYVHAEEHDDDCTCEKS